LQFRLEKTPTGAGTFCSTRYGSEVGENGETRTEKKGGLQVGSIKGGRRSIAVCWLSYVGVLWSWSKFGCTLVCCRRLGIFSSLMKFGALLKVLTWF